MPDKAKRTILVIEDNPDYQELYRHILSKDPDYDYQVFEAENSQAGMKYFTPAHSTVFCSISICPAPAVWNSWMTW